MPSAKKHKNPFYGVLVVVGVVFSITACAYGVMTVQGLHISEISSERSGHPLIRILDEHGFAIMMTEIGILGFATIAAICTDEYWAKRSKIRQSHSAMDGDSPNPAS